MEKKGKLIDYLLLAHFFLTHDISCVGTKHRFQVGPRFHVTVLRLKVPCYRFLFIETLEILTLSCKENAFNKERIELQ